MQAEFQNVIDSLSALGKPSTLSASVSWNPMRSGEQEPSFVLAFNSDSPHLNSSKVKTLLLKFLLNWGNKGIVRDLFVVADLGV